MSEQQQKVIDQLEKEGIHYKHTTIRTKEMHFKCDINPFFPKELKEVIDLWRKLGNNWVFNRDTNTLVIQDKSLSRGVQM